MLDKCRLFNRKQCPYLKNQVTKSAADFWTHIEEQNCTVRAVLLSDVFPKYPLNGLRICYSVKAIVVFRKVMRGLRSIYGIWKIQVKVTLQQLPPSHSALFQARGCLLIAGDQQPLYLLSDNTFIFTCDHDAAHLKGM